MHQGLSCPGVHSSGRPVHSVGFGNKRETKQKAQRSRECIKKGEISCKGAIVGPVGGPVDSTRLDSVAASVMA